MVSGLYGARRDESRKTGGGGVWSECAIKGFTCCAMGFGFYSYFIIPVNRQRDPHLPL